MKKIIALLFAFSIIAGCATPAVVQSRQPQDETLNCSQLKQAYDEAEGF